jgi:hypothetical protein
VDAYLGRRGAGWLVAASAGLVVAGCTALGLSLAGALLPHELAAIGVTPADLCAVAECRVNGFMAHDRAAFGGALVGIGLQYLYLVLGPLRRGHAWAWWLLAVSSATGVLSFLAFLGSEYVDPWHGVGTLLLATLFAVGLYRSRGRSEPFRSERHPSRDGGEASRHLGPPRRPGTVGRLTEPSPWLRAGWLPDLMTRAGLGRAVLLAGAGGVAVSGLEIFRIGVTRVFVTQDLAFMGLGAHHLHALDPGLVPLIAHDRISFGAAVLVTGLTTFGHVWFGRVTRTMWAVLLVAGASSLGAALVTHLAVGYVDVWHLAPVAVGALALLTGLALTFPGRGQVPIAVVSPKGAS